ncbi:hypothetical protein KO500_16700 [Cellulophaga baltica]|uniref:hypothetical protein n=1 Tax=Cellulophaga TaxID=104264 RepID=UPI001C06CE05|nr:MULTISPECIES: hypothetical protein [Cellulophaga]MBU2998083.1 hypothetical protein [Cellulophaga baltica]MDO6769485.1 hypothetical protein [Cellulophaga sp. 1_MG-2023]
MNNEHNPVAQLVTDIQQKWLKEISPYPHLQWVRWIIKSDQARLYEGFLRLESTPHGAIPDIPVVLLTPFENSNIHSKHIIRDWLDNFEKDQKTQDKITKGHLNFVWDFQYFKKELQQKNTNFDVLLVELLKSFQEALPNSENHLTLALFPYTVQSPSDYKLWMDKLLTLGLPIKTRLMVFDYEPENYLESLQIKFKSVSKSLIVPIDLEGAMKKIAINGDPNDPELQFRQCMLEMGTSVTKNNRQRLHQWGQKGIEVTQKSGDKSSFATAHTVYAGMLFNFKEFDTIDKLLKQALTIGKQALNSGDNTAKAIVLQTYGFMASSMQHQKNIDAAADLFCKQAEVAISFQMVQQALAAYITGYTLVKKKRKKRYKVIVQEAYEFGITLTEEELKTSSLNIVALEYYSFSDKKTQNKIDAFMNVLEDENWKEKLAREQANFKAGIVA